MDISKLLSNQGIGFPEISGDTNVLDSIKTASQHEELKAAAKKFEGVFVRQILKQMQETIENASFDPEDSSNQQIHGMYCNFLGDMISQQGGFGLWEKIYEQMALAQNQIDQDTTAASLDEKA